MHLYQLQTKTFPKREGHSLIHHDFEDLLPNYKEYNNLLLQIFEKHDILLSHLKEFQQKLNMKLCKI